MVEKKEEEAPKKEETATQEKKPLSDKERAIRVVEGQIYHWRFLEKALGLDKTFIARKVGALRFVLGQLEKLA